MYFQEKVNTKGFTLIELIGVIILLAAVALITMPIINNTIKNTKEKAYSEQIDTIIKAAKRYVTEVGVKSEGEFNISIGELVENNLLEDDTIKDPRDDSDMFSTLTVRVKYDSDTKSYLYCYNRIDKEEKNECK